MATSTQHPPITTATLRILFEFSYNVIKQNVDGISHEESLRRPLDAGNPLNWVLGHVIATRNHLLGKLGKAKPWTPEEIRTYDRGSNPYADGWQPLPFPRLVTDLDRTQDMLRQALGDLTPARLAEPLPPDQNPFRLDSLGEMFAAFSFHESYHAGQTGILRRVLGRPGAIN
ncbi:MAG: DinB family protein [Candidatus Eiseniibacteriota bacterium]